MTLRTQISEPQRLNLVSTLTEAYNALLDSFVAPWRPILRPTPDLGQTDRPRTLEEDLSVLECAVEISELLKDLGA